MLATRSQRKSAMIVVDMEASGLDVVKHGLLSVGAAEFENPGNTFYGECRLWDGAHIDPESLAVNGFTEAQARDPKKQTDGELMKSFLEWSSACTEKTLAGQNPSADRDLLRAAAHRYHFDWQFAFRTVDLHSVAYMHMTKRGVAVPLSHGHSALSLDKILVYCGLPEEPRPHNGLCGALLEAECFSRLFYDKPLLPDYEKYPIPWTT